MIICPHCGWDNPSEASFCTNCGRGLARVRASKVPSLEEGMGEAPPESGRRFRALSAAGRTARDHDMPLIRVVTAAEAEASGAEIGPGAGLDAVAPPVPTPVPEVSAEPELELPQLRAPAPHRDVAATLVDFRIQASFIVDAPQATVDAPAPFLPEDLVEEEPALPEAVGEPGAATAGQEIAAADRNDLTQEPAPTEGPPPSELPRPPALPVAEAEPEDAEEFPGLEVPLAEAAGDIVELSPALRAEILPLAALSPDSPLRVARIIDSIDEDDIEIPSQPGEAAGPNALDGRALLDTATPEPSLPEARHAVDLSSLGDVDLDGDRIEEADPEPELEDLEEISTSDLDALEPPIPEVQLLHTGDLEAVRPDGVRSAPPPLREMDVRFVLRPLSNNVAESRLISIGERGLVIGRQEGDVRLVDDPFISPRHVRLLVDGDRLAVEDLGSLNGTWLRVRSQVELLLGDSFRVGHQIMRLDAAGPRGSTAVAPDGTHRFGAGLEQRPLHLVQIAADGGARNVYYLGEQGARIGRHIADIVFTEDTFLSGTHAVVQPRGDRALLRDLSSRNGTWVRLVGRQRLVAGDALMIGQSVWRVGRSVS